MTTVLLASAMAAATSLIVAFVSVLAARRNARALELLKAAIVAEQNAAAEVAEELRHGTTHLQMLVAAIQMLKDALSSLGAMSAEELVTERAWKILEPAVASVQSRYAEAVAYLNDHELPVAHRAKGLALQLQNAFAPRDGHWLIMPTEQFRNDLEVARRDLTTLQMNLRDARVSRITNYPATDRRMSNFATSQSFHLLDHIEK